MKDSDGVLATRFLRRVDEVKDNRIRPKGFDPDVNGDLARVARVQVTLYSQSIPPFYLQQRFHDANCGPAAKDDIQRLYYMTSHLNVDGATDEAGARPMLDWKLRIARASRDVR
jgi:hypothetical protein